MKEQERRRSNLANSSLTPTRQRSRSRTLMMSRTERYRAQTAATNSRAEPAAGGGGRGDGHRAYHSRWAEAAAARKEGTGDRPPALASPLPCLLPCELLGGGGGGRWRSGGGICAGESRGMDARLPSAASFRSEGQGSHRPRTHQSVSAFPWSSCTSRPATRREPSTRPPLAARVPGPVRWWARGVASRRHHVRGSRTNLMRPRCGPFRWW